MSSNFILSIETSSNVCGMAIICGQEIIAYEEKLNFRKHIEKLPDIYKKLLKKSQISLKNVSAVAVSIGPGSFTGLRIGLGFAKGLSYSHSLPIIPVPTFLSLAYSLKSSKPISGIIHSHGEKVFYQEFSWKNNIPNMVLENSIYNINDLNNKKIDFQSNCQSLLKSKTQIAEAKLSSVNVGLLANTHYGEWIVKKPYRLVPDYIANFNTN